MWNQAGYLSQFIIASHRFRYISNKRRRFFIANIKVCLSAFQQSLTPQQSNSTTWTCSIHTSVSNICCQICLKCLSLTYKHHNIQKQTAHVKLNKILSCTIHYNHMVAYIRQTTEIKFQHIPLAQWTSGDASFLRVGKPRGGKTCKGGHFFHFVLQLPPPYPHYIQAIIQ